MLTMTSRQRWSIQAAPEGCRVSTESSLSGIGARLFRSRNAERLQADLAAIVSLLKLEAEARIAESSRSTQVGVADDE